MCCWEEHIHILEHILATIIRTHVDIDTMQLGLMPGRRTTNVIFILRQVHEKYLGKHKDLYFAFVDLEKTFDRVPRKVLWGALRKVGVDEWLIRTIQAMYTNAKSSVRINSQFSSWFDVLVYTRVLFSACLYLSLSWKHYLAISGLIVLGNSFMRMTL